EFANFVCWLEPEEKRLPLPPFLRNIFPLNPASRTWICEDHWRILGFAQIQERPSHNMWEVSYLASMVQRNVSSDDVLTALLEYMLEMAIGQQPATCEASGRRTTAVGGFLVEGAGKLCV